MQRGHSHSKVAKDFAPATADTHKKWGTTESDNLALVTRHRKRESKGHPEIGWISKNAVDLSKPKMRFF